jgi:hypothetical protein
MTTTKQVETAAVVRYGQTFYVVVNVGSTVSEAHAKQHAIAAFPFDGAATRRNPACVAAYEAAQRLTRLAVR